MSDIGPWRPAKGTHAIQAASLAVTFAEAVNDKPWKRVEDVVGQAASGLGLTEKQPVQIIEMKVQPNIVPMVSSNQGGFEYIRRINPEIVAEKIHVSKDMLLIEEGAYTRWAPMKSKCSTLMREAYEIMSQSVEISGVMASYTDQFYSTVAQSDADSGLIVDRKSKYVALGAFNRLKPWHTHSGWFEYVKPWHRILHQANIDIGDAKTPDGVRRVTQITTNVTHQFNQQGLPAPPEGVSFLWDDVQGLMQSAHEALKSLLLGILTKEAAQAISLKRS